MIAPTVFSALPGRQPMTTASIVRTRLTLTIPRRSPGRYAHATSFAMTPSSSRSHCCASAASYTTGVSSSPAIPASTVRRSEYGRSMRTSSPSARTSKATKRAGVSSAKRAIRDAAGWMRWPSVPNVAATSSPSTT